MPITISTRMPGWGGSLRALGLVVALGGGWVHAQTATPTVGSPAPSGWQDYDWIKTPASGDSITVKSGRDLKDPFAVITSGSIWQEKTDATYTHKVDDSDALTLSYQSSTTMLSGQTLPTLPIADGSAYDLSRGQTVGLQFKPADGLTFNGNLHASTTDAALPGDALVSKGGGISTESHLPLNNAVLTLGMNTDQTGVDVQSALLTTTTRYDAQYQQPLGKLPLTAVLKGHYEQTSITGSTPTSLPSLEQSLVWKPILNTTVQMGLRQQQYQEYPGIVNQFNQALFADWSQKMCQDLSWHSYAEVVNTRGLIDQAPVSSGSGGANGTAQATTPGSNASLTSTMPVSLEDQTVTFTTGPSFQLQKDISASLEYSNRWDKNPAAGANGQEQRISVSVKGSF